MARQEVRTPIQAEHDSRLSLVNDFSRTSHKSKRSISQEYLQRSNHKHQKRNSMSFSASLQNPSGFGDQQMDAGQSQQPPLTYVDTSVMSGNIAQPNVLNHIMKQINSLKVENLELKKMVNSQLRSSGSHKKHRRVSISEHSSVTSG